MCCVVAFAGRILSLSFNKIVREGCRDENALVFQKVTSEELIKSLTYRQNFYGGFHLFVSLP